MHAPTTFRTGAQVLIDALVINRVERLFSIPGESFLAALDALYDKPQIKLAICRHEGGAAYMAEAHGKLTGEPGICMVTRGPGATNASGGLHIAYQDSTPMIMLIGQVARTCQDREAFQEIDYRQMFSPISKWVAQIDDARRIPEYINRAFATATSGRPGPVVLALPEDMLTDSVCIPDCAAWQKLDTSPTPTQMHKLTTILSNAGQVLIIVGGSGWSEHCRTRLEAFAEQTQIAVANSFRCQDFFNHEHPCYIGDIGIGINPKLEQFIHNTDTLLLIGARLGEMTTTGFTLFEIPTMRQKLIQVHPGAEELGHIYRPELAINATADCFLDALSTCRIQPKKSHHRAAGRQQARTALLDWRQPIQHAGPVQLAEVVQTLAQQTADDSIICNGAGNSTSWIHRFYSFRQYRTQLAPTSGTMGYSVPAAIAAKLHYPERTVIAFAGDGCFMMNGQELATAQQYAANIIVIVINNGIYATIRMHQEREYPGRVIGTDMVNPDFCALARAYGMHAERISCTAEFSPALARAETANYGTLIEIQIDPDLLTPTTTIRSLSDVQKKI